MCMSSKTVNLDFFFIIIAIDIGYFLLHWITGCFNDVNLKNFSFKKTLLMQML